MGKSEDASAMPTPSSRSSNQDSSESTSAPGHVALKSEQAAVAADPTTVIDEKESRPATGDSTTHEEDDTQYPKKWKLVLITIALCSAVFCIALDNLIIAVAIPKITDQFKALNDVGWYGSSYLLCQCAFQLLFGKIYTFYSVKWTFLTAMFIFEVGSLICGVSPNSTALIFGRAIAGLGAAGIFSGAIMIVAYTVSLRQRPIYMGMISSMYGIASVAGPLMGGAFTSRLTWRWCFFINLPFGAFTGIFILLFFSPPPARNTEKSWRKKIDQMDPFGTVIFMISVICLLLALQWGGSKYEWSNGRIIALLVIFGIGAIVFVALQLWRQEKATIPPRLFRNRNVWGGAFFSFSVGGAFFILVYYLPIWFQAIKGVSPVKSGIMNLPLLLGTVLMSIVAGFLTKTIGYYTPLMYASTICMSIGSGLMTTFTVNTGHPKWIGYQFLFGAGIGLGMQQSMVATQTVLPKQDIAIGTAIMIFAQSLGRSLFVSVGQNVLTNELIKGIHARVPDLDAGFVLSVGATEIKNRIPPASLPGVLVAYNDAIVKTWYASVAMSCLSAFGAAFVQWKSVKGKKAVEKAA